MTGVVLHNACLKMEEEGSGLEDIVSTKGVHRWLGRSGIALGGAASLVVGAVFGGILESVPVLLPPPAAAAAAPVIDSGLAADTPLTLAADTVPAVVQTPVKAVVNAATGTGDAVPAPTPPTSITPPVPALPIKTTPPPLTSPSDSTGTTSDPSAPGGGDTTPTVGQQLASTVENAVAPVTDATGTTSVVATVAGAVGSTVTALTAPLTSGTSTSTSSSSSSSSTSSSGLGQTVTTIIGGL